MTRSPLIRHRGYALMVVMAISLVLAIGVGTLLTYLAAAEKNSGRQRLAREAYYVCDGVGRVISKTTSEVLGDSRFAEGATTDLEDVLLDRVEAVHGARLETLLGSLRQPYVVDGPDGFVYRDVDVNSTFGQVGVGRFAGMNGQRRTFTYDLALRRERGSTCRTTATVDTVRVPLSEIAFFSTESVQFCPSMISLDVARRARYHVNGDFVVGTHALPRTTATGSITTGCGAPLLRVCGPDGPCVTTTGGAAVAASSSGTGFRAFTVAELLADGDRGTSALKYPQSIARTQSGDFADVAGVSDPAALENDGTLRYVLDPVVAGDDSAARSNRLASLATIRIIDGVWYLNDGTWPGEAVWSDHPGGFELRAAESPDEIRVLGGDLNVGQGNLLSSTIPRRYSYFGPAGMPPSSRPVVSYGELVKVGDHWEPGRGTAVGDPIVRARAAAKSGFGDVHTFRQSHLGDPGRVLPVNIDLAALNAALDSVDAGSNELGARLLALSTGPGLAHLADRARVIVWVASTWTGSTTGLRSGDASARPAPRPSFVGCSPSDVDCLATAASIDQGAAPLPYPTCARASSPTDRSCDAAAARRPNAVRVHSGGEALTRTITIATPLPLYVLGSMDRGTGTDAIAPIGLPGLGQTVLSSSNTPSLFFAGDTVTLLSDHWNDGDTWLSPDSLTDRSVLELASPPIYNASFLTGRSVQRSASLRPFGGERALRFLERWPVAAALTSPIVTGSLHVGFRSVHSTAMACYGGASDVSCATAAPWRHYWSESLAAETVAPPGMPAFTLRGVGETVPDSMVLNLSALLAMLRAFF